MTLSVPPSIGTLTLDPHPSLAQIRERGPIGWVESLGGWMVVGHALALDVMRDAEAFTVDDPRFTTGQVVGPSMLSTDGAEHTRHRQPFLAPFTPRASRAWFAEFVESETARLVSGFRPAGSAELRTALAAPLATACMQLALGLQELPVDELLGWYAGIVEAVAELTAGQPIPDVGRRAYADLSEAIRRTISTGTGFLGEIASAAGSLTMTELLANTAVLLFGGIETTEGMVANLLLHLLTDPESASEIRSNPALIDAAIEESLRLEPAAAVVDRYAAEAVSVGGAHVRGGDLVVVSLAGANRDPAVFAEPDRFDLHRPNLRRQLAFAQGPHVCLGLHVARLQASQAAPAILALPGVELDVDRTSAPTGLVFRKPAAVQARWAI
ncbi:cytochrome P450 [Nakamurella sp. UYEF19]|uniref:cytochrome P450 n=1 Tax=Nakamurella sp. UYEF19 TaxID=1756392 RepID=UPI003391F330